MTLTDVATSWRQEDEICWRWWVARWRGGKSEMFPEKESGITGWCEGEWVWTAVSGNWICSVKYEVVFLWTFVSTSESWPLVTSRSSAACRGVEWWFIWMTSAAGEQTHQTSSSQRRQKWRGDRENSYCSERERLAFSFLWFKQLLSSYFTRCWLQWIKAEQQTTWCKQHERCVGLF